VKRFISIAASLALIGAVSAGAAEARPVKSEVDAEIFAVIDRQATVTYYLSGNVGAEGLAFGCMEGRRVVLFRVEKGGKKKRMMSAETKFLGSFVEPIELRLAAIPGHYFVQVEQRIRRTKNKRLKCRYDRTPAFLVQIPPGLATAPVVQGV
jgi:hypothetical protein